MSTAEAVAACEQLGIPFALLEGAQALDFIHRLRARFLGQDAPSPELEQALTTEAPDAWRWPVDFLGENRCSLMFDPAKDRSVLLFEHGSDIVAVLEQIPRDEFYVSDLGLTFLLAYQNPMLLAAGRAKDWLQRHLAQKPS